MVLDNQGQIVKSNSDELGCSCRPNVFLLMVTSPPTSKPMYKYYLYITYLALRLWYLWLVAPMSNSCPIKETYKNCNRKKYNAVNHSRLKNRKIVPGIMFVYLLWQKWVPLLEMYFFCSVFSQLWKVWSWWTGTLFTMYSFCQNLQVVISLLLLLSKQGFLLPLI